MYFVYILIFKNKQLYTGVTKDLKRRIREHKNGQGKFTKQRLPIKLIHYEAYLLCKDAKRREKILKKSEGRMLLQKQLSSILSREGIK